YSDENGTHCARARDLRAHRPGLAPAWSPVCRHRCDRWISDRDQCHLAHWYSRREGSRRPGRGGTDLGQDRGEATGLNKATAVTRLCPMPRANPTGLSLIASSRLRRALLLRLEFCDRRTNRCERPVFVLLLAKAAGIRPVGCVDRFVQEIGKVFVEARFVRPRPRDDIGRDVPGLLRRKLRIRIVRAVRHVEVEKI